MQFILVLEDSQRRIKESCYKLNYLSLEQPQQFRWRCTFPWFGFEECLENWIKSKDNPRLVIIDTLARIKPRQSKSAGTAYDADNLLMMVFKNLLFKII